MAIGRPMPPLILDDMERETLERWVRRPKTAQALARRARMILACSEGRSNTAVGADLGVSDATVGKWRARFWGWSGVWMACRTSPAAVGPERLPMMMWNG